jgi:hypothetical protein
MHNCSDGKYRVVLEARVYLLEGALEVWVVNAHHLKACRDADDVKDAQWIAEYCNTGLLRTEFYSFCRDA